MTPNPALLAAVAILVGWFLAEHWPLYLHPKYVVLKDEDLDRLQSRSMKYVYSPEYQVEKPIHVVGTVFTRFRVVFRPSSEEFREAWEKMERAMQELEVDRARRRERELFQGEETNAITDFLDDS